MSHHLYFTLSHDDLETSEEARQDATRTLEAGGFNNQEGYFSGGKCDWFLIGGRWSGELQEIELGIDFHKEAEKIKPPKYSAGYTIKEVEDGKELFEELWKKLEGKGKNPFNRDRYKMNGYDDDAIKLTKEIIDNLKKRHPDVEVYTEEDGEIEVKDLDDKHLGMWITVIDYHN